MFPTEMLSSPTKRKILRVLSEQNKMYTGSELAEMCHRSNSAISRSLENVERFDFIKRKNVSGSREKAYGIDSESNYSSAIRKFFEVENQLERKGVVPVRIWNFLEDVVRDIDKNEGVVEIFLFGSYASGNYHAGSDIDLLVLQQKDDDAVDTLKKVVRKHDFDKEVQIIGLEVSKDDFENMSDEQKEEKIYSRSPVRELEALISLLGEVEI